MRLGDEEIARIRKRMPTVEVQADGGERLVGRLYNVRDLGGVQVLEVASGGRRLVVRPSQVTVTTVAMPAPAKI